MSNSGKKLFGTDGIRGVANSFPMTPDISLKLGQALTKYLYESLGKSPKIIIGKDTRLSGYIFEQAIASGITSMGGEALLIGPLPTPTIAFLTSNMRADSGIIISASHNPYNDNGIKIFDKDGFKLSDEIEMELEKMVLETPELLVGSPSIIGKAKRIDDALGRYVVFLKNIFPRNLTLDGLKIVIDCANGAAYKVAPIIYEELGAILTKIGTEPNGTNINANCGSLYPEKISKTVLDTKSDIGIALDGDADRVIICDEKGEIVDGDKVLAICANEMIRMKKLNNDIVVSTQMSNMALENFLNQNDIKLERTFVGDRYVVEAMRKLGSNLGGEKSGHIIFLDYSTTGDGILASLQILSIMQKYGKKLSELSEIIELFPQTLSSVKVREKKPFDQIPGLLELIKKYEKKLDKNGRINLRYSGTESLARVMVEGKDEKNINDIALNLTEFISNDLSE